MGPKPVPPAVSFPSPNFGERRNGMRPSLVVIHYTAMESCVAARQRLCDPVAEVSAHWLVSETGEAEALVPEHLRAWHAGAGSWAGLTDVNSASIGIELANTGAHPFPEPQMDALETLLKAIMDRWSIAPIGVIGHSDMAPDRKRDPGPRFDWLRLARNGLSVWPAATEDAAPDSQTFRASLRHFGYSADVEDASLLAAFRLRFRPWCEGALDRTDMQLALGLARLRLDPWVGRD